MDQTSSLRDKKNLRKELKLSLANLSVDEINERSQKAAHQLTDFLKSHNHPVRTLGLYAPMSDEVQWNLSQELVNWINQEIKKGMIVCFPHFSADEKSGMKFYKTASCAIEELKEIEVFQKKMLVPVSDQDECIPDCLIIPGLGFTAEGIRLGRGKGYYDRYLFGKSSLKIGLTFETQICSFIPRDEHDINLDVVITDQLMRRVNK